MPRSINVFNLLPVFAHIGGPLSRNNPGATTEVATARMIGHHLKHCQTRSKIINGLKLLRASKSPAEHVGRLDMARLHITRKYRKYSLHRFSWPGDAVTVKQVPMRPTKIIHLTRICKLQKPIGMLRLYLLATFWQAAFCSAFWRLFANHFNVLIHVHSFRLSQIPHKQLTHDHSHLADFDPAGGTSHSWGTHCPLSSSFSNQ